MGQPSTDWNWRVWLSMGLVLSPIGVAVIIATLIFEPPRGDSWYSALTHLDWTLLWLGIIPALLGWSALSEARKSYRGERQRARAIAGDGTAMGLARVKLHGVAPADIEREPLELLWLPERASWVLVGLALFLAFAFIGAITAVIVALEQSALVVEGATPEMPWNVVAGGVMAGALVVALGVWLRARRLTAPTGVVATGEGLRAIRAGKEGAFIPWGEARLLEAWSAKNQSGFALSSARTLVEWRDYPADHAPADADGASDAAMYLRAQTLLATVIARTGLEVRACAPILTFEEQLETPVTGWRSWPATLFGYVFLLGIVGLLLTSAVSAPLVPLTHSLTLNLYIAVTMGGLGLTPLVWLARGLVRRVVGAPLAPTERPAITLPDPPATGALTMRVLRAGRDNAILYGALLLVAGEVYALVRVFTDTVLPLNARPPWWAAPMLSATTLGFTSFIAGAIVIAGLVSREPRGVLDEDGLRIQRGAKRVNIPWEMVAELVITVARGKVVSHKVVAGDSQGSAIVWPDDVGLDGAIPGPSESPGALFAAAVAQRAGVTPTVVYK
jgi:hypothetical protein